MKEKATNKEKNAPFSFKRLGIFTADDKLHTRRLVISIFTFQKRCYVVSSAVAQDFILFCMSRITAAMFSVCFSVAR